MRPRGVAFKSLSRLTRSLVVRLKALLRRKHRGIPTRRTSVTAARRTRYPAVPVTSAPVSTTPVATTCVPTTPVAASITAVPVTVAPIATTPVAVAVAAPPPVTTNSVTTIPITAATTVSDVSPRSPLLRPPGTTILHLPFELLLEIVSYLPTSSLASLILTSRRLHLPLSHALHRRLLYDKPRLTIRAPGYCHLVTYTIAVSTLQWAAFHGNTPLVRELLDTGVWEVDEVYPEPGYATALRTPLCLAVAQAHVETVRVLLDAGAAVWNAEFQRRRGGRWDSPFGWVKDQMVEGMLRVTYKTRSESW